MSKDNLVNVIEKTIQHVIFMQSAQLLAKLENGNSNYEQDLFYIIYNSFRATVYELMDTYTGLVGCETYRINRLNTVVYYLLFSGLGIIGLVCGLLIYYLKSVDKKVNSI